MSKKNTKFRDYIEDNKKVLTCYEKYTRRL